MRKGDIIRFTCPRSEYNLHQMEVLSSVESSPQPRTNPDLILSKDAANHSSDYCGINPDFCGK